jgi:serine phosphatase RsbU (regulator of sigma subunit)
MRVLVGWDDPAEAETIGLFLNVDGTSATVITDGAQFKALAARDEWDVLLMSLDFPTSTESFAVFEQVRGLPAKTPVVGVCYPVEITKLAKFISHGLHGYVQRDERGEFIFLLNSVINAAHEANLAARDQQLAVRLREEIDSVRQLQKSIIPHDLPQIPGFRIEARYEPSQIRILGTQPVVMAGGDYYDFFRIDENTLVLLVGDAAGHGVKACMLVMALHTLVRRIHEQSYKDTAAFVSEINRQLCANAIVHDGGGFITLLYCTLDLTTSRLEWSSAGHPIPLLQHLDDNRTETIGPASIAGLPLGLDADWQYEPSVITIPENSRLALYTDGLSETFPIDSDEGNQFGERGIKNALREAVSLPLDEALDKLFSDSNAFTRGSGRHDDTCLVLIERTGDDAFPRLAATCSSSDARKR